MGLVAIELEVDVPVEIIELGVLPFQVRVSADDCFVVLWVGLGVRDVVESVVIWAAGPIEMGLLGQ